MTRNALCCDWCYCARRNTRRGVAAPSGCGGVRRVLVPSLKASFSVRTPLPDRDLRDCAAETRVVAVQKVRASHAVLSSATTAHLVRLPCTRGVPPGTPPGHGKNGRVSWRSKLDPKHPSLVASVKGEILKYFQVEVHLDKGTMNGLVMLKLY